MILSSFIAGVLSSLTPCVYPLIPITLSVMGVKPHDSHRHGFLVACTYVSGMVILYTILGVSFASLGWLAGSTLQSPWVNVFLCLFMFLMALNLWGVFNWTLPSAWSEKLSHIGHQGGYARAFSMGLVAGLIAAPCTGPILAMILTSIAQRHDFKQGVYDMLAYSLGMGLPFLVLATFSSSAHWLPKSGQWMNRIKQVLAVILVVMSLTYGERAYTGFSRKTDEAYQLIEAQIREAKAQKKKVILDFWADWCTLCHELDEKTLKDPKVVDALKNYRLIRVDVSVDNEKTRGLQEAYGVVGLPTLVFMRSGKKLQGFVSAKDLLKTLTSPRS